MGENDELHFVLLSFKVPNFESQLNFICQMAPIWRPHEQKLCTIYVMSSDKGELTDSNGV